ncbi:MAG: hypothetical protein EA415_03970 [Sphaerobacteraceae bacterium]|nr:MAG: hypothetical protein EA415_03970 [Sphaerobacteraceae bacterium]
MEWLQDNAELISALATVLMTIAWVTYAQFGIITYIRQRQPRIVIDKTAESSINTRFVVVNLSEYPIYISGILVVVRRDGEEFVHKIDNFRRSTNDDGEELDEAESMESQLRHGTLDVGQLFMMGSSRETLAWLLDDEAEDVNEERVQRLRRALGAVDEFEFRVVAMAGNDDKPIAASRKFEAVASYGDDDDIYDTRIVVSDDYTRQFAGWRDRSVAQEWTQLIREN